jgi:molybdate transport system substrate-binding protein
MKNAWMATALAMALTSCASTDAPVQSEPLQVYAAGSLRDVLTEIAHDHEARSGQKVVLTFGASGLLRERIEKGEGAQVFASADTRHPQTLAAAGGWAPPSIFVRNSLCALTQAHVNTTPQTLLETLLSPSVKLGTSTPRADPSGDYAWALFRKAEALRSGAYAALDAKALKLTGGPDSPKPPAGQGTYAWVMDQGQADVFLTYCTNAVAAQKAVPRLKVVQVPAALQVGASYGLTVRQGAPAAAAAFAQALLAPPAQATFARYGFGQP